MTDRPLLGGQQAQRILAKLELAQAEPDKFVKSWQVELVQVIDNSAPLQSQQRVAVAQTVSATLPRPRG